MFEPDTSDRVRVRLKAKISPESRPDLERSRRGGDERQRGGGFGAVLPRFGAFWAIFPRFWRKIENPLPRELNPRLPLYLEGDMTATPGPRLCCRGTAPEPQLSRPGTLLRRPYPRPRKVGHIRGKKRALRELGSARGPLRGK